jgi:molybdate transport system substrate-binding protein
MPPRTSRARKLLVERLAACLLAVYFASACASSKPAEPLEDELTVFAATSLRDAFGELGGEFARTHKGVHVTFNFAGTQELHAQLSHGAAADVFASADQRHMSELVAEKRVATPVTFARNEPVLVVATESAAKIRTLADLPSAERIVLGVPEVPIGRYSLQILERASQTLGSDFRARVEAHVVSRELNVRQVLAKVVLGEAQAAIVYRTDAQSAVGKVSLVSLPADANVIAEYPIALVTQAEHPKLAQAWLDLVLSKRGQFALQRAGFQPRASGR